MLRSIWHLSITSWHVRASSILGARAFRWAMFMPVRPFLSPLSCSANLNRACLYGVRRQNLHHVIYGPVLPSTSFRLTFMLPRCAAYRSRHRFIFDDHFYACCTMSVVHHSPPLRGSYTHLYSTYHLVCTAFSRMPQATLKQFVDH